MSLVLQPWLGEMTRAQIEAHLQAVRARRMVAAMEYQQAQNAKLAHEQDKVQRKIKGQVTMLEKEILRLDRALDAVEKRLVSLATLDQEYGLMTDHNLED